MNPSRWRRRLIGLGLPAGLLLALLSAGPAYAHATVVSSDPRADSVVDTAPTEITVEFSETVSPVAAGTTVVAPDGESANAEPATADGNTLRYQLREDLPEGTYLVSYRVISADGHPVPGGFTFSIGQTSAPPDAPETSGEADPVVEALVLVNRYLGYAGLALALGPGLLLLAGNPGSRAGATKLTAIGLSLVAATAMVGLYLQVPYTAGTTLFGVSGADVGAVLASRFGGAAVARLLVVLAILPLLRRLPVGRLSKPLTWTLAAAAAALALTWPISGHATASAAPPLTTVSDTIHIGAMALWVGGLITLISFLLRPARTDAAEAFLPVWSRWATWLVIALAVAGSAQALIEVGTLDGLISTTYGLLVLVKIGLFVVLVATAAVARDAVQQLGGDPPEAESDCGDATEDDDSDTAGAASDPAPSRLRTVRRMIAVELVIAAVILGVSAVLVQTVPARAGQQETVAEKEFFSKELTTELYTLQFDLEPASVGNNTAHMYLFDPDGKPLAPVEWYAAFGQPEAGVAPVQYGLAELSPNHVSGEVAIPSAGEWEFTFRIRTSQIEEATVTTVVTVK